MVRQVPHRPPFPLLVVPRAFLARSSPIPTIPTIPSQAISHTRSVERTTMAFDKG